MKPIKLTMAAFGAFVNKTEIDFSKLEKYSLFLITGATGSGKTTILDALTFALFGEASGGSRQTENFQSDYSDFSQKCFVKLEFELKQKRYIIEREPKQLKKSARKDGNIVVNSKAKLTLEDSKEITGVENVNQKIVELLGLTCKQFKQIVVLPQGEFQKLLEAKSEDKQEIFRKIFDTEIYEKFCGALQKRTKEIASQIEDSKLLLKSYIGAINVDEDEDLKDVISGFELENKFNINNIVQVAPINNHNKNKDINLMELVDALKESIEKTRLLSKEKDKQISEFEEKKQAHRTQIFQVQNSQNKIAKLKGIQAKISCNLEQKKVFESEFDEMNLRFEKATKNKDKIPEYILQENVLNNKLEYIKDIENLKAEYGSKLAKKNTLEKKIGKLLIFQRLLKLKEEKAVQKNILKNLKNLGDSISIYKQIYAEMKAIEKNHLEAYGKFLAGQAGFLARNLSEGECCPVCGSTSHPSKARLLKDTPSQSYVDSLYTSYKKIGDKLSSIDKDMFENYNFLKDKISEFLLIKYKDILVSKDEILHLFSKHENFYSQTIQEIKNIQKNNFDINIEKLEQELSMEDCEQYIKKFNDNKIVIATNLDMLCSEIKSKQSNLKSKDTQESVNSELNQIEQRISKIKAEFEFCKKERDKFKTRFERNEQELQDLKEQEHDLKSELKDIDSQDVSEVLNQLNTEVDKIDIVLSDLRNEQKNLSYRLKTNLNQYKNISKLLIENQRLYDKYSDYATLSEVSNGRNFLRISFERYILASYFQDVIDMANIKFQEMTGSRYLLKRKEDKERNNRASGLDLEIVDNYTGKARHVNTLSGGEAFKASLCLALGLAEVVQIYSGGVEIDTLFIDEGFGTLDAESLDVMIESLMSLKKRGRLIGVISHVNELKEKIPAKLVVSSSKSGSKLEIVS